VGVAGMEDGLLVGDRHRSPARWAGAANLHDQTEEVVGRGRLVGGSLSWRAGHGGRGGERDQAGAGQYADRAVFHGEFLVRTVLTGKKGTG
jgi:hypothetical protein